MIRQEITKKIGEAMKAGDRVRLETLKLLSSALNYEFISKQHELSEDEELSVVRREAKKRREAIDIYEKAGEKERVEKEKRELMILREYLPPEMSDDEIEKLVNEAITETGAASIKDMGKVIGLVKAKTKGAADGAVIANMVREKLVSSH
jgi:hypothetical protein